MFPRPIEKRAVPFQVSYRVLVVLALVLWMLPLLAIAMTSIRSLEDITTGNYWGLPRDWSVIDNYLAIFTASKIGRYLLNSLIVTIPAVAGSLALATMAGFALAKYRFRGNFFIFAMFIAGNFIPYQILLIPVRDLAIGTNVYNTFWALILFHTCFQTGFSIFFMRNFIADLPDEIMESARVDGVGEWKIFVYLIIPLLRPALAALGVLIFTFVWNDYFWALVLVQDDAYRPITAGLSSLRGQWIASWNLIAAGSIVAALPPVIMFFVMQKQFIAGLTMGTTKG
ncbi:multiple sugar transport system permease protein [Spirochaetota bacterium]|nr:multiple sugar transport system permease protein [Spirochaetota bacterium]